MNQIESQLVEIAQTAYACLSRKGIPVTACQDCVQTAIERLLSKHARLLDSPKPAIQKWVNVTAFREYLTSLRDNPEVLMAGGPASENEENGPSTIESDFWRDDSRLENDFERRDLVRYVDTIMNRLTRACTLSERSCLFAFTCKSSGRCTLLQWIDADELGYQALVETTKTPIANLHRWRSHCAGKFSKLKSEDDGAAIKRRLKIAL